jgi:subtilisin family serine protease
MSRRVVSTLVVAMLLTLSGAAGGRSQEQPLIAADIYQSASQRGAVRVLVQLAVPYVPERQLPSPAHVVAQHQSISTVQQLVRGNLRGVAHRVVRDFRGAIPTMAIEVGPDGLRMLESLRGVVTHVVEDRPRHPLLVESVPRIQANQAVALGYDGRGTTIVIMDSGIDKDHPFFEDGSGASRIVAEACFSSNFDADFATSLCPGASPDEGGTSSTVEGSGDACDGSLIRDGCDHGTLVAGIAAGRGSGVNGVAPGADLVSIQIFSRFDDEGFCGGPAFTPCVGSYPSDQIAAAQYVLDTLLPSLPNIAAINLSLGSGAFAIPCNGSFPLEGQLVASLRAAGVAPVAAAGNAGRNGFVTAPACLDAAVSVGATTDPPAEIIASFSNRAPGLTLLAPGVTINSSEPGGGFQDFNGT